MKHKQIRIETSLRLYKPEQELLSLEGSIGWSMKVFIWVGIQNGE